MTRDQARNAATIWAELMGATRSVFSATSFGIFVTLISGWVLAPGRRTITAMISAGDPDNVRAHDAYHRFVRAGAWSTARLWRALVVVAVGRFCAVGPIPLDVDDTLYKKSGAKVDGAGIFRDAVRSTRSKTVYALGLNLVVITLRVSPPWGRCPLGLPVAVRLHRKGGPTTVDLACEMMTELAGWFPQRRFCLCGDGAYATLCGRRLPRTTVTSRIRRDAACYEPAPPHTRRRGRPRTKGDRLPTPDETAASLDDEAFTKVQIDCRGHNVDVLVWTTKIVWYKVNPKDQLTLVIVRDPNHHQPDDFFITTNPDATGAEVAQCYTGRWSIECTFRDTKQTLGAENPQSWKGRGPERAAMLSLWLYTAIWTWYIPTFGAKPTWIRRPWYPKKAVPSFVDALAALRRCLWSQRITSMSAPAALTPKNVDNMLDILTRAA